MSLTVLIRHAVEGMWQSGKFRKCVSCEKTFSQGVEHNVTSPEFCGSTCEYEYKLKIVEAKK